MSKVYRTEKNNWETEERLLNLGELVIDNLNELRNSYYSSLEAYQTAEAKYEDETYDEEYEDTLKRKYDEGYSDALAMVLGILKESI